MKNSIKKSLALFVITLILTISQVFSQTAPNLGPCSSFAILAGDTFIDDNAYIINGLMGTNKLVGSNYNSDSTIISTTYTNDAFNYLTNAIEELNNQPGEELTEIVNNNDFYTGVYHFSGGVNISENSSITLHGTSTDIIIFNIDGDFVIESDVVMVLDGINPANIFWNIKNNLEVQENAELYGMFMVSDNAIIEKNTIGQISILSMDNVHVKNNHNLYSVSSMIELEPIANSCNGICIYDEKVVNGKFTDPVKLTTIEMGFLSNFIYQPTFGHGSHPLGRIFVGPNAQAYWPHWPNINEYNNDGGNFLMVDGAFNQTSSRTLWQQTVTLTSSSDEYQFMAALICLTSFPTLEFVVNNTVIKTIRVTNKSDWVLYCADWIKPSNVSTAILEIRQKHVGATESGWDYGVDNISFGIKEQKADAGPNLTACYSQPITLKSKHNYCGISKTFSWSPITGLSDPTISQPVLIPTVSTTYTLTTVIDGVTSTDQVNIIVNPPFLSSIQSGTTLPNIYVCPNTPTVINPQVTYYGGTGLYTYSWGVNITGFNNSNIFNPTVNLPAGSYSYNLTIKTGDCVISFTQNIISINPIASLAIDETKCFEPGKTKLIVSNVSELFNYSWDFGNGLTATGPSVILPLDGVYNITLTATNICGVQYSITQQKSFIRSFSNYNQSCCLSQIAYDINTDYTTSSTTTNWLTANDYINATIYVNGGHTLNMNGLNLYFGPKGKIIVMQGGLLSINNTTLNGIYNNFGLTCSGMWEGIEVWGQSNQAQSTTQQGKLVISGTSQINDAHKAIFVGKRNDCYELVISDPINCPPNNPEFEGGFGGGIINVQNATFNRNGIDIQLAPYSPTTSVSVNPMVIKGNNFAGGTLRHPSYNSANTVGAIPFPNARNLYYAPANTTGVTSRHIKIYGVKNDLNFQDNVFDNAIYGIDAIDAQFNVTKASSSTGNVFKNMIYGIYISNTAATTDYPHTILENNFNKLNIAIQIENGRYDVIKKNEFGSSTFPESTQSDNLFGIYFNNTSAFNIADNNFYRVSEAVLINSSGATGGLIDSDPEGNTFTRCKYGVRTSGNNSNLQIRCNNFSNGEPSDYFNRNWNIIGTLANQGGNTNDKAPAGNEFVTPNRKHIYSNYSFTYNRHKWGIGGSTDLAILPDIASGSNSITINNTGFAKTIYSCSTEEEPCNPCDRPIEENTSEKIQIESDYSDMLGILDNNNTSLLLTEINSFNLNSEQLKNLLVASSPLSDISMAALIENYNRLTQAHFVTIMEHNLPMNDELWPAMEYVLPAFTSANASILTNKQYNETGEATLTALERAYTKTLNKRQVLISHAVKLEVDTNESKAMIRLLAEENENKQMAIGTYLSRVNTNAASINMANINTDDENDADWVTIQNIHLSLLSQGKNWFAIDTMQENIIRTIALGEGSAATSAKAVLHLVFGEVFPMQYNSSSNQRKTSIKLQTLKAFNENVLLSIYPNPSNSILNIPYKMANAGGFIEIRNVLGGLIEQHNTDKGYNLKVLDLSNYTNGIYFVTLKESNGKIISTQKVIVQH